MKLLKTIAILLLVIVPVLLSAQESSIECAISLPKIDNLQTTISMEPPTGTKEDTLLRNYIPYYYQFPLEVNVNLIFIQKDNGTGNFQQDNTEHQRFWNEVIAGISKKFTEIQNSNLDSCFAWKDPFLSDSRIRFKFNRYYLKNNKYWNWKLYGENAFGISIPLNTFKNELENRSDIPLGISVFFPENGDVFDEYMDVIAFGDTLSAKHAEYAYANFPANDYISKVCMPDVYCKFLWLKYIAPRNDALVGKHTTLENKLWDLAVKSLVNGISHELGHAFSLDHKCSHYGKDYCRDALMSPSGAPVYIRTYIPPTEIGRMHKALMGTRLCKLVSKDLPIVGTMNISHDLVWNAPFRCYADLNIAKSGSVDMYGAVRMPKKSKIEVSGKLYLMTSNIQCANASDSWQGIIRVKSGGLLYLENVKISGYDIIMEPGSTLVLSSTIEFKNGHKMLLGNGVHVCVDRNFTDNSLSKSFCVNGDPETVLMNGMASDITSKYKVTCSSIGWQKFLTRCTAIEDILYVQNKTLTQDETFVGKTILIGNSVDENRVKGDVIIKSSARATFIYTDRIHFDKGFRCESGGGYRALQYK